MEKTTDLMDQIESAMSPFDDGTQFQHGFCDIRATYSDNTENDNNFADDLVEQIDMDNEYLSCVAKDNSCVSNSSYGENNTSTNEMNSRDMHVPEDILQTAISLQNFSSNSHSCIDRLSPPINTVEQLNPDNVISTTNKYNKACEEVQKYSDLIQLPDMASRYPSIASTSDQVEPVNYSQDKLQNISVDTSQYYDENSNDGSASEFMSWTTLHPENWSGAEVLDWLYYSAEKHGVDCSLLRGEAFRTVTGEMLCNMNSQGFRNLDPFYGDFFYKLFRQLLNGLQFTLVAESSFSDQSSLDQSFSYIESQSGCYSMATSPSDVSSGQTSNHTSPNIYQHGAERLGPYDFLYAQAPGTSSHHIESVNQMQTTDKAYTMGVHSMPYTYNYPTQRDSTHPKHGYKTAAARERYNTNGTPRRRPGRPRIKTIPTDEELQAQREKKLKSQHLWEFIYDMLNNPMYNPAILKWENQSEGVFRFIQSETVAQLWGTLKSNDNMTYEKLSRAMRHYYKRGILERVEGRRLVYKFSKVTLERMNQKKHACLLIETSC
ncbi:hypothetical protein ACF0H5_015306 [Mactra antiquata]